MIITKRCSRCKNAHDEGGGLCDRCMKAMGGEFRLEDEQHVAAYLAQVDKHRAAERRREQLRDIQPSEIIFDY